MVKLVFLKVSFVHAEIYGGTMLLKVAFVFYKKTVFEKDLYLS